MTISDQITRLNNAKAAIKQSIINKGVTVDDSALLDEYPALIDSIKVGSGGEGGGDPYYEDLYNLRTKNGTSMRALYAYYDGTELDLSNLDTSNVTDMYFMFYNSQLAKIDVSNWDTSKVYSMNSIFQGCYNLKSLDISKWNTSSVVDSYCMFQSCNNLTSLDVSNWDTSNMNSFDSMFNSCSNLKFLDVSKWNTSNVTAMNYMFGYCNNLLSLDISSFDTNKVNSMYGMFNWCSALQKIDMRNFNYINNNSSIIETTSMFEGCSNLHVLRLDNCNGSTIQHIINNSGIPTDDIGIPRTIYCKEGNVGATTEPPTNWTFVYIDKDRPIYVSGDFQENNELTKVDTLVNSSHIDLSNMFNGCSSLRYVNTEDWDVSNVTSINSMFSNTYNLIPLDFSNWDTSNVTTMDSMFGYMQSGKLPKLDLSSFNTKKLQQAYSMFLWCNAIQELDIRNFELVHEDGTEVAISSMLEGCVSLHTLRLDNCSNATIRKIINESGMPTEPIYDYSISENINRKMYCKASEIGDLVAPNGWEFVTID